MSKTNSVCEECGQTTKNRKYCSKECRSESTKVTKECERCGQIFKFYRSSVRKFCSRACGARYGKENPSYGGKLWDEKRKQKWSEQLKEIYQKRPELRKMVGNANRGKKFSKERVDNMWVERRKRGEKPRPQISEETRKKIGEKSKQKFTEEYKVRVRKKLVSEGKWLSDQDKEDYQFYKILSDWVDSMWAKIDGGIEAIKESGIFHNKNNKNGVVRDHIYTRMEGFHHRVFPEILRHPANCKVLTNSENSKKRSKSCISLDELFDRIQSWSGEWKEHDLVLELIQRYKNGERYDRKNYHRD